MLCAAMPSSEFWQSTRPNKYFNINLLISWFNFLCSLCTLLKILGILLRQRSKILQQKNTNFMQNIIIKQVTWKIYFNMSVSLKYILDNLVESIVFIHLSTHFTSLLSSSLRYFMATLLWARRSSPSSYSTHVAGRWSRSNP